jgi:hypothetical protein
MELADFVLSRYTLRELYMRDTLCREKICEWAYHRVVDHFHASQDIVAVAFQIWIDLLM